MVTPCSGPRPAQLRQPSSRAHYADLKILLQIIPTYRSQDTQEYRTGHWKDSEEPPYLRSNNTTNKLRVQILLCDKSPQRHPTLTLKRASHTDRAMSRVPLLWRMSRYLSCYIATNVFLGCWAVLLLLHASHWLM